MTTVELVVGLKIPDVTALTAGNAIRRRLGYDDVLSSLSRADYYRIDLDVDDRDIAEKLVREMAEETNLFVNPNKHMYDVQFPEHRGANANVDGEWLVNVLVTSPDDSSGEGIASALTGRLGYDQVSGVETGVLWTMRIKAGSEAEAREVAESITVTRSQSQGILMNPHFQEYEMWVGE
ncbi:MAG: phosphoribosylformylglycinamidine synthase subunit PurS [Armatimonadota bacterium]|jgi:phosphoribosylformylglycinamidine (FGAM) synthase PurS component